MAVNYAEGETTSIKSPFGTHPERASLKLPTASLKGWLNLTGLPDNITNVTVSIGEFVENPSAGDYVFVAEGVGDTQEMVHIEPTPTPSGGGGGGVSFGLPPEEITIPIHGTKIFSFTLLGLEVSIDLKNMTKDAKVALKIMDKPAKIPDPPGTVYSYFENPTNLEPENIHSVSMSFRVNKSWTIINNISVEMIKLCRYASATGWEELETSKIKEDEAYFYFSADTPALSLFAITGEKKAVEFVPSAATTTTPTTPTPPVVPPKPPWALIIGILITAVVILGAAVYYYYFYLY